MLEMRPGEVDANHMSWREALVTKQARKQMLALLRSIGNEMESEICISVFDTGGQV